MRNARGAMGAGAIVSLVFGLLLTVGGLISLVEAYVVQYALPGFIGPMVYLPGVAALVVGVVLIAVAAALSRRKTRRKR